MRPNKILVPRCVQVSEERALGASLLICGLHTDYTVGLNAQLLGNAFLGAYLNFFTPQCCCFFLIFMLVDSFILLPASPSRQGGDVKGHSCRVQRDASLLGTWISGPSAGCHGESGGCSW